MQCSSCVALDVFIHGQQLPSALVLSDTHFVPYQLGAIFCSATPFCRPPPLSAVSNITKAFHLLPFVSPSSNPFQLLWSLAAGLEAPVQVPKGEQPLRSQSSQQLGQPQQGVGLGLGQGPGPGLGQGPGPSQGQGPGWPRDALSSDTTAVP